MVHELTGMTSLVSEGCWMCFSTYPVSFLFSSWYECLANVSIRAVHSTRHMLGLFSFIFAHSCLCYLLDSCAQVFAGLALLFVFGHAITHIVTFHCYLHLYSLPIHIISFERYKRPST